METREKNILSLFTSAGIFKEEVFQKDLDRLAAFHYNEGYIQATVGEPTITHEGRDIFITIPINEGDQYKIGEVDITGDLIVPKETLTGNLNTVEEKVFRSSFLNKDMVSLSEYYTDRGYANVDITALTSINDGQKTVDVQYEIATGEKVYFEKIKITGTNRTRDKVILRELKVAAGDHYSSSKRKRS